MDKINPIASAAAERGAVTRLQRGKSERARERESERAREKSDGGSPIGGSNDGGEL